MLADGCVYCEWETDVHGCIGDSAEDERGADYIVAYAVFLAVGE